MKLFNWEIIVFRKPMVIQHSMYNTETGKFEDVSIIARCRECYRPYYEGEEDDEYI